MQVLRLPQVRRRQVRGLPEVIDPRVHFLMDYPDFLALFLPVVFVLTVLFFDWIVGE